MIEDLLKGKKVLVIGRYNSRYIEFLKQLNKTSNVYFLSVSFTTTFRRKILRFRKIYLNWDIPPSKRRELKNKILKKIKKINPDITIVPSDDPLIDILSEIKHLSNTIKKINLKLLNKKFQEQFKHLLNIPSINNTKNVKFPVVIKPAYGSGMKNVFLIKDKKKLEKLLNYFRKKKMDFVIQNFIPKNFFVIYNLFVYKNKTTGFVYYNDESKEKIIKEFFQKNVIHFLKRNKIQGFISFQCRIKDDKVYTLEINPRIHHLTPNVYELLTKANNNDSMIKEKGVDIKKVKIREKLLVNYIEKLIILNHIKRMINDFDLISFVINTPRILLQIFYMRFISPRKHF